MGLGELDSEDYTADETMTLEEIKESPHWPEDVHDAPEVLDSGCPRGKVYLFRCPPNGSVVVTHPSSDGVFKALVIVDGLSAEFLHRSLLERPDPIGN